MKHFNPLGDSPTPCALAALAARQDNIIARLEQLKEQVGNEVEICEGFYERKYIIISCLMLVPMLKMLHILLPL